MKVRHFNYSPLNFPFITLPRGSGSSRVAKCFGDPDEGNLDKEHILFGFSEMYLCGSLLLLWVIKLLLATLG